MILSRTVVFDLDGTLVDTAPDLIAALNFVLDREGLPPVPLKSARGNQVGRGVDEGAVEVEDNSAGKDHGNSLAAGKASCK